MNAIAIVVLVLVVNVSACSKSPATSDHPQAQSLLPPAKTASPATPASADAQPPGPPGPTVRAVTVPAGSELVVVLDTALGSDVSRVDQPVRAHISKMLIMDGVTVFPSGTNLMGRVTAVERASQGPGRPHLTFRFTSVIRAGDGIEYRVATAPITRAAGDSSGKAPMKAGGSQPSARGEDVRVASGDGVAVTVSEPLVVRVPLGR